MTLPHDMAYIERDGTPWKCEKHQWYFWNKHMKNWCAYVGPVNQNFLDVRMPIVVEV